MAGGLVLIGLQGAGGKQEENPLTPPHHGLLQVRHQCAQARAAQLLLQLHPRKACPECHGLGSIYDFDPAKTIIDWSKPLIDGAMGPGSASAIPPPPYQARRRPLQDQPEDSLLRTTPPSRSSSSLLYGPPKGRDRTHRLPRHLRIPPPHDNLREETKSEATTVLNT